MDNAKEKANDASARNSESEDQYGSGRVHSQDPTGVDKLELQAELLLTLDV